MSKAELSPKTDMTNSLTNLITPCRTARIIGLNDDR